MFATRTSLRPADVAIRAAIVALTLSTAYIHFDASAVCCSPSTRSAMSSPRSR